MTASPPGAPSRRDAATAGIVGVVVAVGVSELLAGLVSGAPSWLGRLGELVVDAAPVWLVEAAIALFGFADKVVLLLAVAAALGFLSACLGAGARHRPRWALLLGLVLGAGALVVLALDPEASTPAALASGAASILAGMGSATVLLRIATPVDAENAAQGAGAGGLELDRRRFLTVSAGLVGVAATLGVAGRWVLAGARVAAARARIHLPRPATPAVIPPGADLTVPGLSPLITLAEEFYRVDTALSAPAVDPDRWRLAVDGMAARSLELRFADLLSMPLQERCVTITCVSNEVGGPLVGTARWLGVRLTHLLELAGPTSRATHLVGHSVDGFTAVIPLHVLRDGRTGLLVVGMNGDPLPIEHGFPARLVVAGLYGYTSAVKWLGRLELTGDGVDGYWSERGWSRTGVIEMSSRIDTPQPYSTLRPGPTVIAGVAWAPTQGISSVAVQVDERPWAEAQLAAAISDETWRQWTYTWTATPGRHLLRVRARDGHGRWQVTAVRGTFPDGATGLDTVAVRVADA